MKKVILGFLTVILSVIIVSCVGYKYGTSITLDGEKQASAYIEYKSNKILQAEEIKNIKVNQLDSTTLKNNLNSKPKGGYIYCHVFGYTIGSANTEYWTCIVSDKNNKEILRYKGEYSIPNMPSHRQNDPTGNLWSNLMLVRLDTNITDMFKVKLIDNLGKVANNYNVYPNQDIRKK